MSVAPVPREEQPTVRAVLRVVVTVVLSVLAVYVIYLVREPIAYILLGGFLAIAASGPVNLLSRKLPRGLAIAIVYLAIVRGFESLQPLSRRRLVPQLADGLCPVVRAASQACHGSASSTES